jgi:WD40 repeat protein
MLRAPVICLAFAFLSATTFADEPRKDEHGDSLPEGALLRIGTVRYRAGASVNYAAISPDGKLIAAASEAGLTVIELDTGKPRYIPDARVPSGYSPGRVCVAFSPDGKELFGVTEGGDVRVWDPLTGKQVRRLDGANSWGRIWFPPRGKELICATGEKIFARVDPASGQASQPVRVDEYVVGTDATGATVVVVNPKRGVMLCDTDGGEKRRFDHAAPLAVLAADDRLLITAASGWEIRVWDAGTGKQLHSFTGKNPRPSFMDVTSVVTTPDGKVLFAGTDYGDILRWDLETGKPLPTLTGHRWGVNGLFVLPDGKLLVSVSWDGLVRRWDLATGKELPSPAGATRHVGVALRPDGAVAAVSMTGGVVLRDLRGGKESRTIPISGPAEAQLRYSPDGKRLAVAQSNGIVNVWELDTQKSVEMKLPPPAAGRGAYFDGLAFSPDGRFLATSESQSGTRLWDSLTGKAIWSAGGSGKVALSADGRTIVIGGWDCRLDFCNAATGEVFTSVPTDRREIIDGIAFSPDGAVLATSHHGGAIHLRDPARGIVRKTLRGHSSVAWSISFSANGKWLASAGDNSVRLWEVATGAELLKLDGHVSRAYTADISPDGSTILSSSLDLTALLWSTRPRADGKPKKTLDALWDDLAGEPVAASRAQWALADDPAGAAALLRAKIAPAVIQIDEKRFAKLLGELDSANFREREAAARGLAEMGKPVEPALRRAHDAAKSAEARQRLRGLLESLRREPTGEELRQSRAVHALELAGGPDAREVLKAWADGSPDADLTRDAKAALGRFTSSRTR